MSGGGGGGVSLLSESGINWGQDSGLHQESVWGPGSEVSLWSRNGVKVTRSHQSISLNFIATEWP